MDLPTPIWPVRCMSRVLTRFTMLLQVVWGFSLTARAVTKNDTDPKGQEFSGMQLGGAWCHSSLVTPPPARPPSSVPPSPIHASMHPWLIQHTRVLSIPNLPCLPNMAGFFVLIIGTLLYNEIIPWSPRRYQELCKSAIHNIRQGRAPWSLDKPLLEVTLGEQ